MGALVTVSEAKAFLRVSSSEVDAQVTTLISGAEAWVARYCNVRFTVASLTAYLDGDKKFLTPDVLPIVSVASVTDSYSGEALAADKWRVQGNLIIYGANTPQAWPEGHRRWEVAYTGGYNDGNSTPKPSGSSAAPDGYKTAVLMLVRMYWGMRGGEISPGEGIPVNWGKLAGGRITDMLAPLRLRGVM